MKCLTVFFMLDTSCNMQGANIDELNKCMREILCLFQQDMAVLGCGLKVKIAVLTFDSNVVWKTSCPIELSQYVYENLTASDKTCSSFDKACETLSSKLDKYAWLYEPAGFYFPYIIIISPGNFSNISCQGLKALNENMFYKLANKFAVYIGRSKTDSSNFNNLFEFTKNPEMVIPSTSVVKMLKNSLWRMLDIIADMPSDRSCLMYWSFDENHEKEIIEQLEREEKKIENLLLDD